MTNIQQQQILTAHYTDQPKVVRPQHVVVSGPENIPQRHLYTDSEANKKLAALDHDVYVSVQNTPSPKKKKKFGLF